MKIVNKIKKNQNKKIGGKIKFGSNCRYRDWDRDKKGFYIWGVEENIAATLK